MSDTQDEITWKLERKKSILALYSHTAYFSLFCVFLYILLTYFTTPENLKGLLTFLALTFFVCYIARDFYYSLNLKTMYIENNNLFIEKYLGKNIVLPLGDFIIFHRMPFYFNFMFIGDYSIESIRKHSLFPIYFFLKVIIQMLIKFKHCLSLLLLIIYLNAMRKHIINLKRFMEVQALKTNTA
ncbi:hypothetical protein [Helicobacter typhlonius]|uniref:hypothetical protein n=1 Tax=Helicobacter typhlonius TaxID=76936 RepID=UPI002FE3E096